MHLTIVGGCFPVQYNIEPARLYHATLRGLLAPHCPAGAPTVAVVRYERFENCLAKIRAAHARQPAGVLLFHLRAEPVMRLAKLYYRYLDDQARVRHALNLPTQARATPERFDLLTRPLPAPPTAPAPESATHRRLRQLNLRLGAWVGNRRRALRQYEALVTAIAEFCRAEDVRLLLIGPVSRPCAREENRLSEQLHAHFAGFARTHGLDYLPALGTADAASQPLFFPNGIHVSPAGHDRMAHLLYHHLRPTEGRATVEVDVVNLGDRPVQVGSHHPFFETNAALHFDRAAAYRFRLHIPAGTAVRFKPGERQRVTLVALSGERIVYGEWVD